MNSVEEQQPKSKLTTKEDLDAPILLSCRDRNFLVTQGQDPDPIYVMAREWVQNPRSVPAAVEARKKIKTDKGIRPFSLDTESNKEPCSKAAAILKEAEAVEVPDVDVKAGNNPTLETHLPRWKALGRKMRLQGAYEKEIGMSRLCQRIHMK